MSRGLKIGTQSSKTRINRNYLRNGHITTQRGHVKDILLKSHSFLTRFNETKLPTSLKEGTLTDKRGESDSPLMMALLVCKLTPSLFHRFKLGHFKIDHFDH